MTRFYLNAVLIGILILGISNSSFAQKKPHLSDKEVVIEYAYLELEESMKSGEFYEWGLETEIKGKFTFDITIRDKGEVGTIFAISREGEVKDQNDLKDFIKQYKFNFKMPKTKSYKFQYTFQFK